MTAEIFAFVVMPALVIAVGLTGYAVIVFTDPTPKEEPTAVGDLFDHRHA